MKFLDQMINKLNIGKKLFLLISLPLALLLVFTVSGIVNSWSLNQDTSNLQNLVSLAEKISSFTHESQKERGATGVFLGSKGTRFQNELNSQRRATDEKLSDLKDMLKGFDESRFDPAFQHEFKAMVDDIGKLNDNRRQVSDQTISTAKGIGYYSKLNKKSLNTIGVMAQLTNNTKAANMITTYAIFMRGKELSGIERAVMSGVFAANKFKDIKQSVRFGELIYTQKAYAEVFKAFSDQPQIDFYDKTITGHVVDEVDRMRSIALNKSSNFGVDPGYWFNTQTGRINLMREVEVELANNLLTKMDLLKGEAQWGLFIQFGVAFLTVLIGIFALYISKNISTPLKELSNLISKVAFSSTQTGDAVSTVAEGAQNQLQSITKVATAMEETSATIAEVSKSLDSATSNVTEAVNMVEAGKEKMTRMMMIVDTISQNSEKISQITEVIGEIANQTHLLSLNATIEAASAGEHGRGFAVVAEEVRKLAENSATSVKDISNLINQAVKESDTAVRNAGEVNDEMEKISEKVGSYNEMMQRISVAMEEQNATVSEIVGNISQLNQIGDVNAAAAEEISATMVELSKLSEKTQAEVSTLV